MLNGENVCQEKETYKVNVTHYVLRNVTVRSYVWCYRFPPRCTNFSVKLVNDTEIREEDGVRYKNVCCAEYELNEDGNLCIPKSHCTVNCINGTCNTESKCYCNPGYRGDDCSKACIANRWGRYCRYHCNCIRGTCDPATGHCTCPSGWSGSRCNDTCPNGTFGLSCSSACDCQSNECNPIDGQCIYNPISQNSKHKNSTNVDNGLKRLVEDASRKLPRNDSARTAVLQKYHTFNIKVLNNNESKSNDLKSTIEPMINFNQEHMDNKSVSLPTEITTTHDNNDYPPIYWKAHDNFVLTLEKGTSSTKSNIFKDNVTEGTPKLLRMKVLKSYEEDDSDMTLLNDMRPREEAYLDDGEVQTKFSRTTHLFFTIGAIAGVSLLLIGVLSLVLAIRRYKRISPENNDDNNENDQKQCVLKGGKGNMMSVTTRSIFHTPLPDPPIINNPIFTTPIESSSTFETHVICSVNISNAHPPSKENADKAEMFYDHPPSTGSYRAVSLPEPPEKDRIHPLTNGITTGEPVYDEIPCWKSPEVECNQIYQNQDLPGIYANSISRKGNQYKIPK